MSTDGLRHRAFMRHQARYSAEPFPDDCPWVVRSSLIVSSRKQPHDLTCPVERDGPHCSTILPHSHKHFQNTFFPSVREISRTVKRPNFFPVLSSKFQALFILNSSPLVASPLPVRGSLNTRTARQSTSRHSWGAS